MWRNILKIGPENQLQMIINRFNPAVIVISAKNEKVLNLMAKQLLEEINIGKYTENHL